MGLPAEVAAQGLKSGVGHIDTKGFVAPVAVFGKDDRRRLPKRLSALQDGIGVLFSVRDKSLCSAFCVGDDMIATAAHCFYRTAQEPLPDIRHFVFGRIREEIRTHTRIAGFQSGSSPQNVLSGSMRLRIRPPIEATRDWALARLAKPLCRGHVLKLRPMTSNELVEKAAEGSIYQVAYHRDFPDWQLALSDDCTIKKSFKEASRRSIERDFVDPDNLILHTCDTGGASSGSPLLMDGPTGPEVVGINVGTYVQSKVAMRDGEVVRRYKAREIANTGVNISVLAQRLGLFASAAILDSPDRMRTLQAFLKAADTPVGAIDGAYGPNTRAAIEAYERRQRLPVTGLATESLLQQLAQSHRLVVPTQTGSIPSTARTRDVLIRTHRTGRHTSN